MKLVIVAALTLAASAAPSPAPKSPEEVDRAELRSMEAKVDRLIGTAACEVDLECSAMSFGAKPCGGPWKYKVYSKRGTNIEALRHEVAAYNARNTTLNAQYGWKSDCSFVSEPAVGCAGGRCASRVAAPPR